jgi:hypothetical protein
MVPAPPQTQWWKQRRRQVAGGLGLVLALVAGLAAWLSVRGDGQPPQNRVPFYLAVDNLSRQPVVHYSGSALDGTETWDLRVTSGGETLGTVTAASEQVSVMTVGGKTYVKPPQDLLTNLPAGVDASSVQGKWITGDAGLAGMLPQGLGSPSSLASALWTALDGTASFPPVGTPAVKVGAQAAMRVATPAGEVYITTTAPYRVLRLAPKSADSGAARTGATALAPHLDTAAHLDSRTVIGAAWPRPAALSADAGLASVGQTDIEPMSTSETDQAYSDLINQTKTLTSAVNVGVSFDFNQTGNLNCSETNCTVVENVATSTTSSSDATLSGTVTAVMTAQVTVNGQAAGGCTQTESLPINGSGTISCSDPAVAPVVEQIKAEKQQEADQQAQASGQNVEIPYSLDYEASVQIEAMADVQAEVDQEVGAEQGEKNKADQAATQSTPCASGCRPTTFYHGSDVASLLDILNNGLDADNAAANYTDGPGGFFVATHEADAEHFAVRNGNGGVIKVTVSDPAMSRLQQAGAVSRPIPMGPKSPNFEGYEFHIPTSAFDLFNQLRASGEIVVSP